MNKELPHKCLHAQCKHCFEFVPIYDHQCYITSEEEKQFKRQLQQFRRRKNKTEAILGMVAEGLPDVSTQLVIDELVTKRKKKLKELDQINSGVPMAKIKAQAYEERLIRRNYELKPLVASPNVVCFLKTSQVLFDRAKNGPLDFTKWENLHDSLLTRLLRKCSWTKKL